MEGEIVATPGGTGAYATDGRPVGRTEARAWTTDIAWLAPLTVAVLALCALPYVLAALFGPADLQRLGTFWFIKDFSQYEAAMREGASQSGWLIHDHFSAEPHAAALMYPLYVGAGKLAALLGVGDLPMFAALEWLGRLAVVGALYAFASTFVRDPRQRRLAMVLSLGTLGLDAWTAVAGNALAAVGLGGLASVLPNSINPYLEVSSLGVLLSAPHLMLGLALTLLIAPLYLCSIRDLRWLPVLGLAALALSLVHSFNTPVVASVLAVHALLAGRRAWPAAVVVALAVAPMGLYSVALYHTDPFWSGTYSAQNVMPAPPVWSLPLDFGLVLLAAPLSWRVVRGWPAESRRLLLLWIGLGLLWMYAPVPYQRRFGFGVQPGLALLAGVGLLELNAWMRRRRVGSVQRRAVNYGVLLLGASTSTLVYLGVLASALVNRPAEAYLWTRPEAEAAAWLGDHSTAADVVLASTDFSNPLAGAVDGRVVHGHIVATLHSDQKQALVSRFFASDASASERRELLRESGATLVAFGPSERKLGAADLSQESELELVYDRDGVELYRVVSS